MESHSLPLQTIEALERFHMHQIDRSTRLLTCRGNAALINTKQCMCEATFEDKTDKISILMSHFYGCVVVQWWDTQVWSVWLKGVVFRIIGT